METNGTRIIEGQEEEIALSELLPDIAIVCLKHKMIIFCTTMLFAVIGLIYAFFLSPPPLYASKLQTMLVAVSVSTEGNVSLRSDNSIVDAVIRSDSMRDAVNKEFHMMERMKISNPLVRKKSFYQLYDNRIKMEIDKENNTINIFAYGETPIRAQAIATFIYKKADEMFKDLLSGVVGTVDETVTNQVVTNKQPLSLRLLSPATYPDDFEPRKRVPKVLGFTLAGFFVGLIIVYMKHSWSMVDENKKRELKALMKL